MFKVGDKVKLADGLLSISRPNLQVFLFGEVREIVRVEDPYDKEQPNRQKIWIKDVHNVKDDAIYSWSYHFVLAPPSEIVEKPLNYKLMLMADLRKLAVQKKIVYRNLRKADLIAALEGQVAPAVEKKAPPEKDTFLVGKELVKRVGRESNVCSFAAEYSNGDTPQYNDFAPCHAQLDWMGKPVKVILDISGHYYGMKRNPLYKKWVEYWLNDSPMAYVFETKTFAEALEHGIYIDTTKYNSSHVAVAAIGLREGSEFASKGRLKNFNQLVKAGVHKRVAWVVACNFNPQWHYNPWTGAHQVMSIRGSNLSDFYKWLKTGQILVNDLPMSESQTRYSVSRAICRMEFQNGNRVGPEFYELFGITYDVPGWDQRYTVPSFNQILIGCGRLHELIGL